MESELEYQINKEKVVEGNANVQKRASNYVHADIIEQKGEETSPSESCQEDSSSLTFFC